jgi:hypothetical protein
MADRKVTWLHLSDFHVGMDGYAQRKLLAEIVQHIHERSSSVGFGPDLIFMTGDIANRGQVAEYEEFLEAFYIPLVGELGNTWDGKIFAIPGNHDADRNIAPFFDRDAILSSGLTFFDPSQRGKQLRAQITPRFDNFAAWIKTAAPEAWLHSDAGAFDILVDVRGISAAIIGLNTAWLSKDDHDRHRLTPGAHILEDALNRQKSADIKIVLGHHPFGWLDDKEAQRIRTILARHNAIYLAGHLHEDDAHYEDGGAGAFLTLRSGSAFQGRTEDKPKWVNGFQWAEIYIDRREVLVQAFHWSSQHREWKLTTDAFPNERRSSIPDWWSFALPSPKSNSDKTLDSRAIATSTQSFSPPTGWVLVDRTFLATRAEEISREKILQYFDGRPPDWSIANSNLIPQRKIVAELYNRYLSIGDQSKPTVVTLLGAGGEGKSTTFLQTVSRLVTEAGWIAIYRHDDDQVLSPNFVDRCAANFDHVIVAVDDAHSFAESLQSILLVLKRRPRQNVHFLLCARTIDWLAEARRHLAHIVTSADYQEIRLSGLQGDDVDQIVTAWAQMGKEGLNELYSLSHEEAVERLRKAASNEGAQSEDPSHSEDDGVLLGAMLKLRYGHRLKDRVRSILYRLKDIEQPGAPLIDAYAAIAIMHAEGLRFLSQPVLAAALNLSASQLRKKVLNSLADEAIVAGGGRFVLTRHKEIARVSVEVLRETNLYGDFHEIFPTLARAALAARGRGEYVPELHKWDYDLPNHFLVSGRPDLAIACAEMLQKTNPDDIRLRVNLSKVYRDQKMFEKAVEVFRSYSGEISTRASWTEWSVAEVSADNVLGSVLLAAVGLCDLPQMYPPSTRDGRGLIALSFNFLVAYEQYREIRYRDAAMASAQIGLRAIADSEIRERLEDLQGRADAAGTKPFGETNLLAALLAGVRTALEVVHFDNLVQRRVSRDQVVSFEGLLALAHIRRHVG